MSGPPSQPRARAAPSRRVERYQSAGALFGVSWPKAAWFVEGQGRWGVAGMSECPLKLAFVPLGSFIHTVGARPPDVSVITYLQRLKEQGWDVTRTERKLLMCGGDDAAAIMPAASPAEGGSAGSGWGSDGWALGVQLPGSRRLAAGPWWPCEVVDPWRPPMGFLFLLDHMTALDEHERRMYVPGDVTRGVAKAAVWSAAG
ncbi:hypothetical protein MNEG_16344 [Monoraphidium neglectum]|uniref:Uncharacterized protein n=1 Tax=Monoraphidium neglectum TaxID=145388 RepID=A0A0D2M842_9CHLO|nr:hypothetical protein MNEG_16344 [Monoraphidium neglectum]KIY91620.1 hypothetical protein MNEG_16344 [Monoraphidium neglectum]|eukprot:XP_013890640.1 hypothetical protein MNEG_16344 [Monoraphidium neglectum]